VENYRQLLNNNKNTSKKPNKYACFKNVLVDVKVIYVHIMHTTVQNLAEREIFNNISKITT